MNFKQTCPSNRENWFNFLLIMSWRTPPENHQIHTEDESLRSTFQPPLRECNYLDKLSVSTGFILKSKQEWLEKANKSSWLISKTINYYSLIIFLLFHESLLVNDSSLMVLVILKSTILFNFYFINFNFFFFAKWGYWSEKFFKGAGADYQSPV